MRKTVLLLAACVAAISIAAPAGSAPKTKTFTAKLKGINEVPGPGDPDGRGKAVVRLNPTAETVCYVLTMKKISDAVAAHIHQGAADVAGPVVVTLIAEPTTRHRVKSCATDATPEEIDAILADPKSYYVNVHTEDYGPGAIRGQLRKGGKG